MRFAAEQPAAGRGLTRRAMLGGGLTVTLAGCNSAGLEMPNDAGGPAPSPAQPAGGPPVGEALGTARVRGRNDPAADPKRRAKPDRRLDAQRGATRDQRFRLDLHHLDDSGRPFEPRRRRPGGSIGAGRWGPTHPRACVRQRCADGVDGGKISRAADDRVLDRRHRRGPGRLSLVLPDPGLRRPDPSIRRIDRQEVVRDHGPAERLRQCRGPASSRRWRGTSMRKSS